MENIFPCSQSNRWTSTEDTEALESSTRDIPSLKSPEATSTGGFSRSHCPSLADPASSSPFLHSFFYTAHCPPPPGNQNNTAASTPPPQPSSGSVAKPLIRGPRAGESWKCRSVETAREAGPQLEDKLRCSSEQTPGLTGTAKAWGWVLPNTHIPGTFCGDTGGSGGTLPPCEPEWGLGFGSELSLS